MVAKRNLCINNFNAIFNENFSQNRRHLEISEKPNSFNMITQTVSYLKNIEMPKNEVNIENLER